MPPSNLTLFVQSVVKNCCLNDDYDEIKDFYKKSVAISSKKTKCWQHHRKCIRQYAASHDLIEHFTI